MDVGLVLDDFRCKGPGYCRISDPLVIFFRHGVPVGWDVLPRQEDDELSV